MCSFISYLFRISVNGFFPFMCTAQLKLANKWIPFYSFVWFSLSTHPSFQILFLHLAALPAPPMPCAMWPIQSCTCHSNCNNLQQWRTRMNFHLHTTVPTSWFSQPRELKLGVQRTHTARPQQFAHSRSPPESEPASNLKDQKAEWSEIWEVVFSLSPTKSALYLPAGKQ